MSEIEQLSVNASYVKCAADVFGIDWPRIYYPACGDDNSLSLVGDVLYVDPWSSLKEAVKVDAREYEVEEPVDLVAFFHSPYFEEEVLRNAKLKLGGLVVWRIYNAVRPPLDGPVLNKDSLAGLVKPDNEGRYYFDDNDLESYFELTPVIEMNDKLKEGLRKEFTKLGLEFPEDDPAEIWRHSESYRPQYNIPDKFEAFVFQIKG